MLLLPGCRLVPCASRPADGNSIKCLHPESLALSSPCPVNPSDATCLPRDGLRPRRLQSRRLPQRDAILLDLKTGQPRVWRRGHARNDNHGLRPAADPSALELPARANAPADVCLPAQLGVNVDLERRSTPAMPVRVTRLTLSGSPKMTTRTASWVLVGTEGAA